MTKVSSVISQERIEAARRLLPIIKEINEFYSGLNDLGLVFDKAHPGSDLEDVVLDLLGIPRDDETVTEDIEDYDEDGYERSSYSDMVTDAAEGRFPIKTHDVVNDKIVCIRSDKTIDEVFASIIKEALQHIKNGMADPLSFKKGSAA